MREKGCLYIIPNTIGNVQIDSSIPVEVRHIINKLDYFIAENEKKARILIKLVTPNKLQNQISINVLNKYTSYNDSNAFLDVCLMGKSIGLISDAGCPAIADPGSSIICKAHNLKIKVRPLVGPSSIFLALMSSGMNGQNFSFNGYLPIEKSERRKKIKFLEKKTLADNQSQIFMETPYRNNSLFKDLINTLSGSIKLCIATDITLISENIKTKTIDQWRRIKSIDLNKRPTIFIIDRYQKSKKYKIV